MKLANLFLITALVGVLAAIGCSDNPPPQDGNGGTGGGADLGCDEGNCVGNATLADACETWVTGCIAAEPANEDECVIAGLFAFCGEGGGGAGGAGGGGGTGGTPDPGTVCASGLCLNDADLKALCEDGVGACLEYVPEINWDECIVVVVRGVCEE